MTDLFVPSAPGRTAERRLLERIARLEKRADAATRTPQLVHSALDDGAVVVTSGGTTTGIFGQQFDGTVVAASVGGPVPPIPSAPIVEAVVGGLRVNVLGTFVDPQPGFTSPVIAPQDFARYDVEVSPDSGFPEFVAPNSPSSAGVLGASGGQVKVAWPAANVPLYVRVRTRTLSGKRSDPSLTVGPINSGAVGLGDLGFDLSNYVASNSVMYGTVLPSVSGFAGRIGTLFLLQTAAGPPPRYTTYRYTGATWDVLQDQGVSDSLASAVAAQIAADTKAKVYNQTTMPTGYTGAANTAVWFDSDDGNRPYRWNGTTFASMQLGNGAIAPNSLVASNVIATGTVTAALMEAIMVLTTTVIAGDASSQHSRLDAAGLRAFVDDEGIPVQVGFFGQGFGVINPNTGEETGGITDAGDVYGQTLAIADPNPTFGGVTLSDSLWNTSQGNVAYGRVLAGTNPAGTNGEAAFLELGFTAQAGRQYTVFIEGMQPLNLTTAGGWYLRVRSTSADAPTAAGTPTTSSTLLRAWNWANDVSSSWNDRIPQYFLYNGPVAGAANKNVRLLFTYGVGTGTAASTGASFDKAAQSMYAWVQDMGPLLPETGDEISGGTSGGTTTKTTYTYTQTANWVRTWNQSGSIIYDDEMHQGYGDSFNGIRRSMAGWTNIPSMTGATVNWVKVYMESYWFWATGGGTLHMGYSATSAEPATYSGAAGGVFDTGFTARAQGKWITCPASWATALAANGLKGINLVAPNTSSTYYAKFKGPASARPQLQFSYTK